MSCQFVLFLLATGAFCPFATGRLTAEAPTPPPPASLGTVTTIGGNTAALAATATHAFVGDGQGIISFDLRGATPIGIARWVTPGYVTDIVLADDWLIVGAGSQVILYQLAEARPIATIAYQAAANVQGIVLTANHLYVGTMAGLEVVAVRDRRNPVRVGVLEHEFGLREPVIAGTTLYALGGIGRYAGDFLVRIDPVLISIDVREPSAPQTLAEFIFAQDELMRWATAPSTIRVHEGVVYIAGSRSGSGRFASFGFALWTFSAADLSPLLHETYYMRFDGFSGTATDLRILDDYLLVPTSQNRVNLVNRETLELVTQYSVCTTCTMLAGAGTRLLAARADGGVQILDLTDLLAPTVTEPVPLVGTTTAVGFDGPALVMRSFHSPTEDRISTFDMSRLTAPLVGQELIISSETHLLMHASGVHVLYSATNGSTQILDARIPGQLHLSPPLSLNATSAIAANGDFAYIAGADYASGEPVSRIDIFNLEQLATPQLVGHWEVLSETLALAIDQEHLYHLDAGKQLQIFSLAEPQAPALLGAVQLAAEPNPIDRTTLTVYGGAVYIPRTHGVQIVDVRTPTAPALGELLAEDRASPTLAVSAGRLALAETVCPDSACRFQVFDLAKPLTPTLLAQQDLPHEPHGQTSLAGTEGRFALAMGEAGIGMYTVFRERVHFPLIAR
jgi:hypothetical protein